MRARKSMLLGASLALIAGCGSLGPQTDSGPPQLVIIAPTEGATVGHQVLIEAAAVDDIGVDKVRFLIDDVLLQEVFTPPYQVIWHTNGLVEGSIHRIGVQALDVAKNVTSKEIPVVISTSQNAP